MTRALRIVSIAAILFILLGACASSPPPGPRPEPSFAPAPATEGPLAELETSLQAAHGDERSGFMLLDRNEDGLKWRITLIDSAQQSLDMQYYLWFGDQSGLLLAKHVLLAADRGVKVRIIVDDLDRMLENATKPRNRDRDFAAFNAHHNIELRLFNRWHSRTLAGRGAESIGRMKSLNQRMHNKQMIADNRVAIIGGRNLGDEYFGLATSFNFHDLDVVGVGPVARQASKVFDSFWNSEWVSPVGELGIEPSDDELDERRDRLFRELAEAEELIGLPLAPRDWSAELAQLSEVMSIGTSRTLTDSPDSGAVAHHMPKAIRELIGSAEREVLITNAYIIPGDEAVPGLRSLIERGVSIRALTNSLASHDVPAVNSKYKKWRKPLLEIGVDLYEMRPDAAIRGTVAETPPVSGEFMGLHSKGIVIDRERVFIGSANLDPRSFAINSEMGMIIESPGLARKLAEVMERDMQPENAWRVELDENGRVRWVSGDEVLTRQPARSFWQRVQDIVFMVFPASLY